MDSTLLLVALALLGVYGFLIYKGKKLYQSKRSIAVLVVTTILALILLVIWVSGQTSTNIDVCGVCGGTGQFFGKSCVGCYGTGYGIETTYDVWWCFWVALAVLGVGLIAALLIAPSRYPKTKQLVGMDIEFSGRIADIDSSAMHITVRPQSEVPWALTSRGGYARCHLSDVSHKAFLAKIKMHDIVTIKGTVLSENKFSTTNLLQSYNVKVIEISK